MSDLTGITIPSLPLRKNTIQKYVPDTPPPQPTSTTTPYTANGAFRTGTVKVAPTSRSGSGAYSSSASTGDGGYYIAGTSQWDEPTVMYFPPSTAVQKAG